MKRVAVIFCAVLTVALAAQEVEIPSNLKRCNKQAGKYEECMKDAIQDGISKLVRGNLDLGIPVLDPYVTASQETEYTYGSLIGKVALKDVSTYGASRARVLNVRSTSSEDEHRLEIGVTLPRIFIEGEYKAEGRLNDFKVGGKGFFNVSMEGVKTVWDITGRIEDDRWVIEHFNMLPEVEKMKVYFDDLFNGNEGINSAARSFVNEYWPLFYREMLPFAAAEWDKQITELLNVAFSKISYSKLFA